LGEDFTAWAEFEDFMVDFPDVSQKYFEKKVIALQCKFLDNSHLPMMCHEEILLQKLYGEQRKIFIVVSVAMPVCSHQLINAWLKQAPVIACYVLRSKINTRQLVDKVAFISVRKRRHYCFLLSVNLQVLQTEGPVPGLRRPAYSGAEREKQKK
jgi:hypothetical protein